MPRKTPTLASVLLRTARSRAALTQRGLARRAGTAQSVVARIEAGETSPTWATIERLLGGAGFGLAAELVPRPVLDRQMLEDVPRILRMSPEERLREVGNVARFVAAARRA